MSDHPAHIEHKRRVDKCKMFAQHPFEQAALIDDPEGWSSQIVGVNFASQTVMLRDFNEYDVDELRLIIEIEAEEAIIVDLKKRKQRNLLNQ